MLSIPVPRILKCQVFGALHPQPQPPDRTHRMVVIVSILKPRVWLLHRSDQIIARKNILEGKSPISGKSRLGNIPSIMDFRIVRNGILWNSWMPYFLEAFTFIQDSHKHETTKDFDFMHGTCVPHLSLYFYIHTMYDYVWLLCGYMNSTLFDSKPSTILDHQWPKNATCSRSGLGFF